MSNCKVLVADDVFANQFLLASMLEELSVGFKTVSNGKEVLDELPNDKYDIIFMDIEMPVMNGIEATKQIKNDYRFQKIPVIIPAPQQRPHAPHSQDSARAQSQGVVHEAQLYGRVVLSTY